MSPGVRTDNIWPQRLRISPAGFGQQAIRILLPTSLVNQRAARALFCGQASHQTASSCHCSPSPSSNRYPFSIRLSAGVPTATALAFTISDEISILRWKEGAKPIASNGQGQTRLEGHTDYVTSLTWSPDGALLASGSEDSALRVWDAQTKRCVSILRGHSESVLAVAFSPDGSLLASAGSDRNVRLWDLAAEAPAASLVDPKSDCFTTGLAWSPDGRLLAAARWPENVVRVWDVAGRQLLSSLPCTLSDVEPVGLGFIPDGQLLAAP